MSMPSSRMAPEETRIALGRSPMIALAVTDFPDPRLADDAQDLATLQIKRDVLDRMNPFHSFRQDNREVTHGKCHIVRALQAGCLRPSRSPPFRPSGFTLLRTHHRLLSRSASTQRPSVLLILAAPFAKIRSTDRTPFPFLGELSEGQSRTYRKSSGACLPSGRVAPFFQPV